MEVRDVPQFLWQTLLLIIEPELNCTASTEMWSSPAASPRRRQPQPSLACAVVWFNISEKCSRLRSSLWMLHVTMGTCNRKTQPEMKNTISLTEKRKTKILSSKPIKSFRKCNLFFKIVVIFYSFICYIRLWCFQGHWWCRSTFHLPSGEGTVQPSTSHQFIAGNHSFTLTKQTQVYCACAWSASSHRAP